jgi:hypothetical protein
MVAAAAGRLAASMTAAADCLRRLLGGRNETVQLGAANSILRFGAQLREQNEIEDRLRALEERERKRGESG